ncbi:MAG TPA: ABC transporter substrate-binding protein [Casimicrobiaceae bacterium]|nr:ABC transporter substrate-binding protein [Casimicrobiaceae bacterium]
MLLAAPLDTAAQQPAKIPRIGILLNSSGTENLQDLRQGLRDLGYSEGQTIVLDVLSAEGKLDQLPTLATELVRRNVDVIVASGPQGVGAARRATGSIPIVMGRMDDVEAHGFVTNLARPGGNITGLSFQTGEMAGKLVQLLKEAVPDVSRLAVIWDETGSRNQVRTAQEAARALGLKASVLELRGRSTHADVVSAARIGGADGLVLMASPGITTVQGRLAELALQSKLPAIYYNPGFAEAGGLLAYGPSASAFSWRRAAAFVDKILKGAKPADLPIEQPTTFELIVNLKTAKALRVTIPSSLLQRADRVIQ